MQILPDPRRVIADGAAREGESLAALSRMIRRDDGYLARYVSGGRPVALAPDDRRLLAAFLRVPETHLGADDPRWTSWRRAA